MQNPGFSFGCELSLLLLTRLTPHPPTVTRGHQDSAIGWVNNSRSTGMNSGQGWEPAWCKLSYFFLSSFFFFFLLILLKSLMFLSLQHSKLTPWQRAYFYLLYWLLCTNFFFFSLQNGIKALTGTSINSSLALQDDLCFHLLHCFLSSASSLGFHLISSQYNRSSFHLLLSRL